MRAVIQRVKSAQVSVVEDGGSVVVGKIGTGLCVLVGVTHGDGPAEIAKLARKIMQLKLLRGDSQDDPRQRQSAQDVGAPVLLVSQFTLYADVRKGTKPGWSAAAPGEVAEPVFKQLVAEVEKYGIQVETGRFGAMMDVALVNDGPMTILVEV